MNDHLLPHHRRPVVIADSRLRAGQMTTHVKGDDPEALLMQYLRLVRRIRNQQRDRTIALRRADIVTLAEHLGWTDDEVLTCLADLMGASQRQRAAMLAVLATGATLITFAGPLDMAVASNGGASPTDDIPVVVVAEHLASDDRPDAQHTARVVVSNELGTRRATGDLEREARHAVPESPHRRADQAPGVRVEREVPSRVGDPAPGESPSAGTEPTAEWESAPDSEPEQATEPAAESAPVSAAGAVAEAPAVGTTGSGGGTTADVAVGEPPIPPATDPNGNHVAVGEPPIPPAPREAPTDPTDRDT